MASRWAWVGAAALLFGCRQEAPPRDLRIATTTSVENSGLLDEVAAAFQSDTGIRLEPFVVGSGQAMRLAERGEVDLIITHDPPGEAAFVQRVKPVLYRQFMWNEFVIVGPPDDPARISGAGSAAEAFTRIFRTSAIFASRGDESGTHAQELRTWSAAGVEPVANPNYRSLGQSMSQLLRSADQMRAYALTDRATWDRLKPRLRLALLFDGDPSLKNVYAVTLVRDEANAKRFVEWLLSDEGRSAIESFRIGGKQQFFWVNP